MGTAMNHPTPSDVVAYYDALARDYDRSRFGGSYGRYIDAQERRVLRRWLAPHQGERVLDLGCGTGRFLDLATDGVDPSAEMVRVAREKGEWAEVVQGSSTDLPYESGSLGAVFSMHVLMHLDPETIGDIIAECARVVRQGGSLIIDIPSPLRRRLTGHKQQGWHGATALSRSDLQKLIGREWRIAGVRGLLSLPIQRLPHRLRPLLRPLDDLIGLSPAKSLSSYALYHLVRTS